MLSELGTLDLIVLIAVLFGAIAIGVFSGRSNRDSEAFLVGGRNLPWWAILGSIVATETSTATVLSLPGDAYAGTGFRWLQFTMGLILGRIVVVKFLLPIYFRGSQTTTSKAPQEPDTRPIFTAYQTLEERLGKATQMATSLLFLITRNLGDGLRLYLAAIVLQTLLGWSMPQCVVVMGLVTMAYTAIGGLRSVIWNDCVQFVIYMIGGIAAVIVLARLVPGGYEAIWGFAHETGRLTVFDFSWDLSKPLNFWGGLFGGAVLTIGTHGTDQIMVQRYLSARSERDAGRAVLLSAFVVMLQFTLFLWIGVSLACFFANSTTVPPDAADQVFAFFIVNLFPQNVGLIGLMLAAILAAAMSTLSSSLSASASALLNDFYLPFLKQSNRPTPSDRMQLRTTQAMTIAFGVLQMVIAVWASHWDQTVVTSALKIAGFAAGLLLGVFALGLFSPGIHQRSVLIGAAAGLVVLTLLSFVIKNESGEAMVAWTYLAAIGATTTFVTAKASERITQ